MSFTCHRNNFNFTTVNKRAHPRYTFLSLYFSLSSSSSLERIARSKRDLSFIIRYLYFTAMAEVTYVTSLARLVFEPSSREPAPLAWGCCPYPPRWALGTFTRERERERKREREKDSQRGWLSSYRIRYILLPPCLWCMNRLSLIYTSQTFF